MQYSVYSSPQAAFDAVRNIPDWCELKKKYDKCSTQIDWMNWQWQSYNTKWNGGTFEEVEAKFNGDHGYEATLLAHVEESLKSAEFFKKRFHFQNRLTCGQRVDIARYLAGDSRCWSSVRRRAVKNFAVRVFAPMGGLSSVTPKMMRVCGALTCAVCEALEQNGIGVEVWATCECSRNFIMRKDIPWIEFKLREDSSWTDICHMVKVKDSSQYTDYGMVSYVTGDNGFYRNVIFKDRILMGCKLLEQGAVFGQCGASRNFDEKNIPPDEDFDSSTDIVLPRIYDMEEAKYWLEHKFTKSFNKIEERRANEEVA